MSAIGHRALRPAAICEPCGSILVSGPRAFWAHTARCRKVQRGLRMIVETTKNESSAPSAMEGALSCAVTCGISL